jgi:hypothetical protein
VELATRFCVGNVWHLVGNTVEIIEVKINTRTPWKLQRAIELIREHIPMQSLLGIE